jgi:hypothetical protein
MISSPGCSRIVPANRSTDFIHKCNQVLAANNVRCHENLIESMLQFVDVVR